MSSLLWLEKEIVRQIMWMAVKRERKRQRKMERSRKLKRVKKPVPKREE